MVCFPQAKQIPPPPPPIQPRAHTHTHTTTTTHEGTPSVVFRSVSSAEREKERVCERRKEGALSSRSPLESTERRCLSRSLSLSLSLSPDVSVSSRTLSHVLPLVCLHTTTGLCYFYLSLCPPILPNPSASMGDVLFLHLFVFVFIAELGETKMKEIMGVSGRDTECEWMQDAKRERETPYRTENSPI